MAEERIYISDTTLCNTDENTSFKEKIDIVKRLDAIGVDSIVMPPITNEKADVLLIHTVAPLIKHAAVLCESGTTASSLDMAWGAVKACLRPGIVVALPTSTVQMEYICHKKAPDVLKLAEELVTAAVSYGADVTFKAQDASRADGEFLNRIIKRSIDCGAKTVILCDSTGSLLPDETAKLVYGVYDTCGFASNGASLGVECSDMMSASAVNSFEGARHGARVVNTTCTGRGCASLLSFADIMKVKGEAAGLFCKLNYTTIGRTYDEISKTVETKRSEFSPFDAGVRDGADEITITAEHGLEYVVSAATSLGYDLSDADADRVFENAHRLAMKKPIGKRELEAVIATSAMQLPSTYNIKSYVINSGNVIGATAHVELEKQGEILSGLSVGDGPIDAAFLSIEQIVGRHFELDDFQIRSVTEGREAVGEALVKIRFNGKLYSGRGVSTDIIGASIRAYVKALNKICYEEEL